MNIKFLFLAVLALFLLCAPGASAVCNTTMISTQCNTAMEACVKTITQLTHMCQCHMKYSKCLKLTGCFDTNTKLYQMYYASCHPPCSISDCDGSPAATVRPNWYILF
eukprot:gnl/Trimastix_PCT/2086.p1 GENE.gnl/Trimastix_PCT/2086~~gnl/Trimastix_PCT/2086.p1  ORF type:complete len:120 (-),score=12.14 gnl/Trimastix_PCT/2086:80-403(-)